MHGVGATNLGGGGRYDSLSRALGGPHTVPALGFACTLESLLEVMPADDPAIARPQPVIVAPAGSDEYGAAIRAAREVRTQGVLRSWTLPARQSRRQRFRLRSCKGIGIRRPKPVGGAEGGEVRLVIPSDGELATPRSTSCQLAASRSAGPTPGDTPAPCRRCPGSMFCFSVLPTSPARWRKAAPKWESPVWTG